MATMVGTQQDLNDLLEKLIELDFDAVAAYDAAVDRLSNETIKARLNEFKADHLRHTRELGKVLQDSGRQPPTEADAKGVLTKGKVVIAGLGGDKAVLTAMRSNEEDTNTAYERAVQNPAAPASVRELFRSALSDERRHRDYIDQQLSTM
jgi:uncharacterized protein (TIGR02284 family)